jgi:hypothetical protein
VTYEPLRETPRGDMPKSHVPYQTQAERVLHDEKLYGQGKAAAPFPEEKAVMSIYGGLAPMSHIASLNSSAE